MDMAEQDNTTDSVDTPTGDTSTVVDEVVDNGADTDAAEDKSEDMVTRAELNKVIAQRQALKDEIRALKNPDKGKPEDKSPDPADTLRDALRRTAATSVLATAGITDKGDQAAILSVMNVSTLPVSEDGTVDTDTLGDTLSTLRRVFGAKSSAPRPRVDPRPRADDGPSDPDKARYDRIMGRRA